MFRIKKFMIAVFVTHKEIYSNQQSFYEKDDFFPRKLDLKNNIRLDLTVWRFS